jgi:rSAM/selenodomain-associated transferase 2/rSAM/selenodomain-associated transferase 1
MSGPRPRLILFTRPPVPGKAKSRLIPELGAEGAASLHRRLVLRTLRTAHQFCRQHNVDFEIRFAGHDPAPLRHWLGDSWSFRPQSVGDLGHRMSTALSESLSEGSPASVLIGSDCPGLSSNELTDAFNALKQHPAVFGPAADGGYYLVGLTQPQPRLFEAIPWGSNNVLALSLDRTRELGITSALVQLLDDLDRPEDLHAWNQRIHTEEANPTRISVIIPTLNEASHLAHTLDSIQAGNPHEILVVDAHSTDQTPAIAAAAGARVISSSKGRARQMNAGAAFASGQILLFLHADTRLPAIWPSALSDALLRPGTIAGAFTFALDQDFPGKRWIERITRLRSVRFQRPYGDQGLFLTRARFEEMGGFANLPIMEDYELIQRLRKLGRITIADAPAITSSRRWQRLGWLRTTLINQWIIAGFHLGIAPERLARFYQRDTTPR